MSLTPRVLLFDVPPYYKAEVAGSSLRIRSFSKQKNGEYLSAQVKHDGYQQYKIKGKYVTSHKLIANHLFGEHKGLTVNHIDGDKLNNSPSNLELCTRAENIAHAINLGLHVSCDPKRMPTYKDGRCSDIKEYKRDWYLKNREKCIQRAKERYEANKQRS